MSFNKTSNKIEENDTVLLYINYNNIIPVEARANIKNKNGHFIENVLQTQFGVIKPVDLIGKEYGSNIQLKNGYVYVLKPSSVLWTKALPHRTQIIYPPDISMIMYQLEVAPGSVIIESGTGSGALSHSFIRKCKPTGHLHTFEINEERFKEAQQEFRVHGLSDYVTVYKRDVCENGFGDELIGKADAIFLDLPSPHLVVPFTVQYFKTDEATRFCSFSPCIEQVQRTCQALEKYGFTEIQTMELIPFYYTVTKRSLPNFSIESFDNVQKEEHCSKKRKINNEDDDNDDYDDSDNEQLSSLFTKKKREIMCGKNQQTEYLTSTIPSEINSHTGYITVATMLPVWARDICLESNNFNSD